jgi:hypothetical protein
VGVEELWGFGRAVLLGVLLLVLLLRLFEDRLIFFPDGDTRGEWDFSRSGVAVEDIFFTTRDGVRLHGWWVPSFAPTSGAPAGGPAYASSNRSDVKPAADKIPSLLYFHGNAGNLTDRIENIAFLRILPANVLAVDYRGYGKSQGRPSEEGVYRDAEAAYDYLVQGRGVLAEQVVLLGQSLGTAVAVDLATRRPVGGLILECGFPSARRVAQKVMWLPGLRFLLRSRFDSAAKLKANQVPVLVAHCQQDPVLPYALGEELYAAANPPKMFVSYPGACHEPLYVANPTDYAAKLRSFLETVSRQGGKEAKDPQPRHRGTESTEARQ